jgi:hypothetical protein
VLELPADIGLLSLRELGPTIAQLRQHHQLNILSTEAVAAATSLQANVPLTPRRRSSNKPCERRDSR